MRYATLLVLSPFVVLGFLARAAVAGLRLGWRWGARALLWAAER